MPSRPLLEIDREHKRVIVRTRHGPVVMSYRAAKRAVRASRALLGPGRLSTYIERRVAADALWRRVLGGTVRRRTCSSSLGASGCRTSRSACRRAFAGKVRYHRVGVIVLAENPGCRAGRRSG